MRFRTPITPDGPLPDASSPLPAGTDAAIAIGAAALLAAIMAIGHLMPLSGLLAAAAVYGTSAWLVRRFVPTTRQDRFGAANVVTLGRAVLTAVVTGLVVGFAGAATAEGAMTAAVLSAVALSLDGLDGWLARRQNLSTVFGARFDMEVDAFLILVLSVAAVLLGKAGQWAVLIGAMRYAFVAAAWRWPWLSGALPPSFRRKAVCVQQAATLCIVLLPGIPVTLSASLAFAALLTLTWSFAEDVLWLFRHREQTT